MKGKTVVRRSGAIGARVLGEGRLGGPHGFLLEEQRRTKGPISPEAHLPSDLRSTSSVS